MKLCDYIQDSTTFVLDAPGTRDELLKLLSERAAEADSAIDAEKLYEALLEREAKGATAMPEGVALPHALVDEVDRSYVIVARLGSGVDFHATRGGPVDLVFLLIGPREAPWEHIRILARVARICHTPGALDALREASNADMLYQRLVAEDKRHV